MICDAVRESGPDVSPRSQWNGESDTNRSESESAPMFNHVIVGIDGERTDRDAIELAKALAPHAELELVFVYPYSENQARGGIDAYGELVRDGALRRLEHLRADARVPQAQIRAEPSFAPAKALKRRAAEAKADLIVLGATSRTRLDRVVIGDVARGVLHGAPCPVLDVARGHADAHVKPKVIGVAYDRTPESVEALQLAIELAGDIGARLEIVEALDVSPSPAIWGYTVTEYLDSLVGPEDERMRTMAESLDVPATGRALRGPVHQVLRDLSVRVDLMVCGSRSWGMAGRIAFGGTADRLVHQSPCPVLVVPRGADVAAEHDASDAPVVEATR